MGYYRRMNLMTCINIAGTKSEPFYEGRNQASSDAACRLMTIAEISSWTTKIFNDIIDMTELRNMFLFV